MNTLIRQTDGVASGTVLSEQVAAQLLAAIEGGQLTVGSRLASERELGAQFGVSRTVVREALKSLAAIGAIEVRSGASSRVTAVSADQVAQVLRLHLHTGTSAEDAADLRRLLLAGATALGAPAELPPSDRVAHAGGPLARVIFDECEGAAPR
ncbi:MAG: hypothetical protein V7607_1673 [Solirubrobacteraceae bacterium]